MSETPSLPRRARERVRQTVRTAAFLGVSAVVVPPFALHMAKTSRTGAARVAARDAWVQRWAGAQLRVFGIRPVLEGAAPNAPARGRLLVANHRSAADIAVLLATFGGVMVSRADVATWPVLGLGARTAEMIFVDRSLPQSGAVVLRTLQRRLAEGHTICVFPEGTTLDGDEVRPFHVGGFLAAQRAGAEVLPIGLAYPAAARASFTEASFGDHLTRIARGPGFPAGVAFGPTVEAEPGERAAAFAERARGLVQGCVARARGLVGA